MENETPKDWFGNELKEGDSVWYFEPEFNSVCDFRVKKDEQGEFYLKHSLLPRIYFDDVDILIWLKGCPQMRETHPKCTTCKHFFVSEFTGTLNCAKNPYTIIQDAQKHYCSNHETNKD